MGIPSLNSAILYNVSLNFHSNHANITNIPDLGQENRRFYGQKQKTTAEAVVKSLMEGYSFHHSLL